MRPLRGDGDRATIEEAPSRNCQGDRRHHHRRRRRHHRRYAWVSAGSDGGDARKMASGDNVDVIEVVETTSFPVPERPAMDHLRPEQSAVEEDCEWMWRPYSVFPRPPVRCSDPHRCDLTYTSDSRTPRRASFLARGFSTTILSRTRIAPVDRTSAGLSPPRTRPCACRGRSKFA